MQSLCRWNIRRNVVFLAMIMTVAGVLVLYNSDEDDHDVRSSVVQRNADEKYDFVVHASIHHTDDCFRNNIRYGIEHLYKNVLLWRSSKNSKCKASFEKFDKIYRVDVREGKIYFHPKFANKVHEWLGYDPKLFEEVKRQKVTHVYHKYSHKLTAYNPLRAKRPTAKPQKPPKLYIEELINQTLPGCDFCNAAIMTAGEIFGRVQGKSSRSAANTFKIDKWHGLFIPDKHSILEITIQEFVDLFNTSLQWFGTVASIDRNARFPVLFWDTFPAAGASQVHVHVHGILGDGLYRGALNAQLRVSNQYIAETSRNYWQDLVEVHDRLGLAAFFGKAVAIAPLTSEKDHELLLISQMPNTDIYSLLYFVIQTYHSIDRFCYSSSMALPLIGYERLLHKSESLPTIIRIGTRGECSSTVNDVYTMSLNWQNSTN
ncbi:uncharacterized protein LOC126235731 isoform X1 [Schistocerca nitens]|uniref:uncharacterized protein LOC126235731 isoform X1 n=1 Tax=Schistocerca nitens TaxID=7011 RepID=UPI0021192BF1|nr:uncharacterized protein LOC126235731 isoform X1 [Schistocerca nitens]